MTLILINTRCILKQLVHFFKFFMVVSIEKRSYLVVTRNYQISHFYCTSDVNRWSNNVEILLIKQSTYTRILSLEKKLLHAYAFFALAFDWFKNKKLLHKHMLMN